MPLPGACTRNASAVDPSRITRCGKSGQCSNRRIQECAMDALPALPSTAVSQSVGAVGRPAYRAAEGHVTVRQRMLTAGARLEEQSLRQEPDIPPMTCEHKQLEFCMPDDPLGSLLSASTPPMCEGARNFEIAVGARADRRPANISRVLNIKSRDATLGQKCEAAVTGIIRLP